MLDIKLFRESPDVIRSNLEKRGWTEEEMAVVDEVIECDRIWRKARQDGDRLKHERNVVSEEIAQLKKSGKDIAPKVRLMKDLSESIRKVDEEIESQLSKRDALLLKIPNLMHESVPVGKDDSDNVPIRQWGEPKKYDFPLKSHQDIIEDLGQGDFRFSGKTSGAGFYYLYEDMVMLDYGLMMFAVDFLRDKGFTVVEPPLMLRRKAMSGLVDISDFEDVLYRLEGEDLYLIATSEHPLGAMHMGEKLREKDLPLRYCGISPCFRKEIGAHGVDTRGIFRTHQFNKVEQFIYSTPEQSWAEHELMISNAEELHEKLEIPFRIVNVCTGDLGGTAAKKYDLEAWMAKQQAYKEVVSCSNCTTYQARKLNIRFDRAGGDREFVHTMNSTAIATSRTMIAILENNQQEDGTVMVPKVLRPYMNNLDIIGKVK